MHIRNVLPNSPENGHVQNRYSFSRLEVVLLWESVFLGVLLQLHCEPMVGGTDGSFGPEEGEGLVEPLVSDPHQIN